jgi:predicted ATP-grasp superfamily ATP-dependent carboligase
MAKKTMLYVNTRSLPLERRAELQAIFDLGMDLVLAGPPSDIYSEYDITHFIPTPTNDFAAAGRCILDYLDSNDVTVDGIVSWGDQEVELVAQLGELLQIPSSSPLAAINVRNKAMTRRCLERVAGVNPRYRIIAKESDLDEESLRSVGVPALLKPAGASGGRGIFEVTSHSDALATWRAFRDYCVPGRDPIYAHFSEECVLEEKVIGSEHSVAGLVANGEVYIFAITDKRVNRDIPLEYQSTLPTTLSPAVQEQVVAAARAAVTAVGIDQCGFHVDLMVTDAGPKILEIGGRLGGECINSHLIPIATDGAVRPYELLLQLFRDGRVTAKKDCRADAVRRVAFRHILPPGPGRITSLTGLDELEQHPRVREVNRARQVGDMVWLPGERPFSYTVAHIIVEGDLDGDMSSLVDDLDATVDIEIEPV